MSTEASRRPTLSDVAARAGVSASTASLAFSGAGPVSDETKAKVLAAAAELDYAGPDPRARSLRQGKSGIVGVVSEGRLSDAFRDSVSTAMFEGVSETLGAEGYSLLLITDTGDGGAGLAGAPLDGVILVGCSRDLDAPVTAFRQRGIPVVAVEAEAMEGALAIDLDNRDATARGARYLFDLGHRNVAVIALPMAGIAPLGDLDETVELTSRVHTTVQRIRGARDVFPGLTGVAAAGSTVDDGLEAGRVILARNPRPTAVIAQSDLLALGVIRAAEELGLAVPEDLSVLGFDGVRIDGLEPYVLTTLAQPSVAKGRAAAEAVIALIAGEDAQPRAFTSELRVGTTTASPKT